MRRTIPAILAGVVTSGLTGVVWIQLDLIYYTQEALAWVVPRSWPDVAFGVVLHSTVGMMIGLPGAVVAVLIARRRVYPPGHCRRCGYDLTGNTSGVCPERGGGIGTQPMRPRVRGAGEGPDDDLDAIP